MNNIIKSVESLGALSSLFSLISLIFQKAGFSQNASRVGRGREGGAFPTLDYTGRLRPKGVPFQIGGIYKGRDFTTWGIEKDWENCHLGIKRDFQNILNRRT